MTSPVVDKAVPGVIIDLSSNNGDPNHWDWAQIKTAVIAVFVKATDGTDYVNDYYADTVNLCVAHSIHCIAYHFAEFGNVTAEAQHFVAVAGGRARILDSETNTNVAWQDQFLADLGVAANQEMDYGSASTLPRGVRGLLWPASYGKNYGFGDCWQYTDAQSIPGIPVRVDASQWIGSQVDFNTFFGLVTPVPQPVPVPPPTQDPRGPYMLHTVTIPTDANGDGWVQTEIPWSTFMAISIEGSDPGVDLKYFPGNAKVQDRGGNVLASVVGYLPLTNAQVFILASA